MDSDLLMIRPNFLSAANRLELEQCLRRHREEYGIARRANAILLLDKGKSCAEIAEFLYLDDDTIRGWFKVFRQEGWDTLAHDGWQGGQSRLTSDQETKLSAWLEDHFCRSAVEIRAFITAKFELGYSHSGCLKMLGRLGFEYRKPRALPRVADEDKQAEFIAFYQDLMTKLPADEAVYFADAVHPEYQSKPSYGWARKGSNPAIQTASGRGRVNIHGALKLETFDAPFVEPTTVDGVSSVQLLAKIEARNPDKRIIHVIWDNARYHKGPIPQRPRCQSVPVAQKLSHSSDPTAALLPASQSHREALGRHAQSRHP